MKLSLAIPNYNRVNFVLESFKDVIDDNRISEIIIYDDYSDKKLFEDLQKKITLLNNSKIELYRQNENVGAFYNKKSVIMKCTNEFIILLDSDNILTKEYLDAIPLVLDDTTIYVPIEGICHSPNLKFFEFKNVIINKSDFIKFSNKNETKIECLFNLGNFVVNRKKYLETINNEKLLDESYGCDVYYFNYLWFKNNLYSKILIVDDMRYHHRLHNTKNEETSFFIKTENKSMEFLKKLKIKINEL